MNNTNKKNNSGLLIIIILILLIIPGRKALNSIQLNQQFNNKTDGLQYNGDIHYTNKISKNKITIEIPENFDDKSGRTNYYIEKKDTGLMTGRICKIMIDSVANYSNAEHLSQGIAKYNSTESEQVMINGTKWYHTNRKSTPNDHTYVTDYNNSILIIEADYTSEKCAQELLEIINTVKVK